MDFIKAIEKVLLANPKLTVEKVINNMCPSKDFKINVKSLCIDGKHTPEMCQLCWNQKCESKAFDNLLKSIAENTFNCMIISDNSQKITDMNLKLVEHINYPIIPIEINLKYDFGIEYTKITPEIFYQRLYDKILQSLIIYVKDYVDIVNYYITLKYASHFGDTLEKLINDVKESIGTQFRFYVFINNADLFTEMDEDIVRIIKALMNDISRHMRVNLGCTYKLRHFEWKGYGSNPVDIYRIIELD